MPYGDVEALLRDWLDTATDSAVTVIVEGDEGLPSDLTYSLPLVAVSRFGGGDTTLTLDEANLDVDCFAADYPYALALAEQVRASIRLDLPGHIAGTLTVARVRTITAPVRQPWQATGIHRVGASYQLVTHARMAA